MHTFCYLHRQCVTFPPETLGKSVEFCLLPSCLAAALGCAGVDTVLVGSLLVGTRLWQWAFDSLELLNSSEWRCQ